MVKFRSSHTCNLTLLSFSINNFQTDYTAPSLENNAKHIDSLPDFIMPVVGLKEQKIFEFLLVLELNLGKPRSTILIAEGNKSIRVSLLFLPACLRRGGEDRKACLGPSRQADSDMEERIPPVLM
jgi:hypothetical protein